MTPFLPPYARWKWYRHTGICTRKSRDGMKKKETRRKRIFLLPSQLLSQKIKCCRQEPFLPAVERLAMQPNQAWIHNAFLREPDHKQHTSLPLCEEKRPFSSSSCPSCTRKALPDWPFLLQKVFRPAPLRGPTLELVLEQVPASICRHASSPQLCRK